MISVSRTIMLADILCSPRAAATFSTFRNKILGYSEMEWHPPPTRLGALTIAPPKLRQLHTKTAVMARISKLLTKPLPSARAGTVTQPSPGIPHGPERSPALTTLQLRGPRMTCAAQYFPPPCLPSQRQRCFVETSVHEP